MSNISNHNEDLSQKKDSTEGFPPIHSGEETKLLFPPKPQEPLQSDCCGTGCTPCVFDLYDQELLMWKDECERIRHGGSSDETARVNVVSPDQYQKFELTKIELITPDSFLYTFNIPGYRSLPMSVGQHLVLRWLTKDKVVTRQYTPVSLPSTKGRMEFIIKLYPDGKMSEYISSWKVGDKVEWRGPFGNFSYKPNQYKRLVMLAAGTGITPMVQVIQSILDDENDETRLHVVYACPDHSAILCQEQMSEWACFWNFAFTYYFSKEPSDQKTAKRFSTKAVFSRLKKDHIKELISADSDGTYVLICGTKSFEKDMINYLSHMGKTTDDYFKF